MINELILLKGEPFYINDTIKIKQPTLDEICNYGELEYFRLVNSLTATPSDYKSYLFDQGIDYTTLDEFDLFSSSINAYTVDQTRVLFGELDFTKFVLAQNKKNNEIVLYNPESDCIIDNCAYILITDCLRKMHNIKKNIEIAGNDHTKKYLIDRERRQLAKQKKQQTKSQLLPIISAMVNCELFKYDHFTVWKLPIYVFFDSVQRIQKTIETRQIIQGIYAGNIDGSKISQDKLNWLGELTER